MDLCIYQKIMEDQSPYKTNKPAINPKELRIGNLVQYSDGGGYTELSALAIHDIEQGLLKVEPIWLTEEILIKAGFRRTDVLEYIDDNAGFIFVQSGNYGYELTKGEYSICFTRTVNHLQNLYFALIGCELEIKL